MRSELAVYVYITSIIDLLIATIIILTKDSINYPAVIFSSNYISSIFAFSFIFLYPLSLIFSLGGSITSMIIIKKKGFEGMGIAITSLIISIILMVLIMLVFLSVYSNFFWQNISIPN